MSNIHPLLVHFPVALLTASFLFDFLGLITKKQDLERAAWWSLLSGAISLAVTVATGLVAERVVSINEVAREHFETHKEFAFIIATLYAILFFWRITCKTKLPNQREWYFVGLSFLGVILIWCCAWYGGELVYRFGVGVQAH